MRIGVGIFIVFMLLASALQAQKVQYGRVKGTVIDSTDNNPLEAATVSVFLTSDSSLVSYALTGKKGDFTINDVPRATACWLMVSYNGYSTAIKNFRIPADKSELDIRLIRIDKNIRELGQVTVVAQKPPVVIKQDTIEFNVGSFTTRPNAMILEVLKQMPGVEIESDGSIIINGKKVSKVTLDGKEFFGGDPKIALQNLPKEIIEKIQVSDNRSREARFNKTKTGNEDVAINLTLRKDRSKGWFGMAAAGYGTDKRYEGFANLNYFNGNRQLNFLANANNTNRGNYSGEGFNIGNSSGTLGGGGTGIQRTQNAGVNFSDNPSARLKLNGSYFFNRGDAENITRSRRQNILPDTTFFYNSLNKTFNDGDNHRLSLNLNYNPDSLTEIYFNTSLEASKNRTESINDAVSQGETGKLINSSDNAFISNMKGQRANGEFFIGRRFGRKGRGITFNMNYNYNNQPLDEANKGENIFYKEDTIDSREDIDQRSHTTSHGNNISMGFNYSEPVLENLTLNVRHNFDRSRNVSDKLTNRYNPATGEYDKRDSLFSNAFQNTMQSHMPGMTLLFQRKNLHWTVGAGWQFLSQENVSLHDSQALKQDYINFSPTASIGYNFSKTFNVEIYYNGRSQAPSIQQLQPVPDNRNPLYIVQGNPDLQPSFYHNVHMNIRRQSGTSFWHAGLNINSTQRQIINETFFDEFGRQVSRPINVNGNYSLSWNMNYSKSWKKRNWSFRLNVGNRGNLNRTVTFTNKAMNRAEAYSFSPTMTLNFTWKQILSLQPNFNVRYNIARYSLSNIDDVRYNSKRLGMTMFWNHPRRLIVENSLQYNYNSRTAPGFRKGVAMWSAAVNWQLLSKEQATIRLAVYDILKQAVGVRRTISETYVEDYETQVLQQYFLLSFIYNLRRF